MSSIINDIDSNSGYVLPNSRVYKTARRRSLSGSSVPSKTLKNVFGLRSHIEKMKHFMLNDSVQSVNNNSSTDMVIAEIGSMDISVDESTSSSSGGQQQHSQQSQQRRHHHCSTDELHSRSTVSSVAAAVPSSSSTLSNSQRICTVSAKTKLKHYLVEHIAKSNSCQHPEYHHSSRKDNNLSASVSLDEQSSSSRMSQDLEFCQYRTNSTGGSVGRPKSMQHEPPLPPSVLLSRQDQQNSLRHSCCSSSASSINLRASNILDKIRHITLPPCSPSPPPPVHTPTPSSAAPSFSAAAKHSDWANINPAKIPKVECNSSLVFSPKSLLGVKNKRHRLAHSVSYDPEYRLADVCKNTFAKKGHGKSNLCPATLSVVEDFSPERDKWERKISGYLQTSTPTGATLTAINFGLKRVTETDKYVMITKSPGLGTNEFLEEGIKHVQATCGLYNSLMQHTLCYDLMPDSGKIVILDSHMQIGRAVDALEDNVVRAAPVWHSDKQEYSSLLSVYDLTPLLLHMHHLRSGKDSCLKDQQQDSTSSVVVSEVDFTRVSVEQCLRMVPALRSIAVVTHVSPETSLRAVLRCMNQLRRPPLLMVADWALSGNPLYLLTAHRILHHIHMQARMLLPAELDHALEHVPLTSLPRQSLEPLPPDRASCQDLLHTARNPVVSSGSTIQPPPRLQYIVERSSCLTDVLRAIALSHHPCAIVTFPGASITIQDVITISDVLLLVKLQRHQDPDMSVAEILALRLQFPMTFRDPVISCRATDSLQRLFDVCVRDKASFVLVQQPPHQPPNDSAQTPQQQRHQETTALLSSLDVLNMILAHEGPHPRLHGHSHAAHSTSPRHLSATDSPSPRRFSSNLDETAEEVFDIDVR